MPETVFAFETSDHEYLRLDRNGTYTLGSQNDASFCFDDASVAPTHAKLIKVGERLLISPVDGDVLVNGTLVVQRQIDINVGDEICIGDICLLLRKLDVTSTAFQQATLPSTFGGVDPSLWQFEAPMQDSAPPTRSKVPLPKGKPATPPPPTAPAAQPAPPAPPPPQSSGTLPPPQPANVPGNATPPDNDGNGGAKKQSPYVPASRQPTFSGATPMEQSQAAAEPDEVLFNAYYPRQAEVEQPAPFLVYAFVSDVLPLVEKDVEQYAPQMGGAIPKPRQAKKQATIAIGTPLTVTLSIDDDMGLNDESVLLRVAGSDEASTESVSLTQKWEGDFTPYAFEFLIPEQQQGDVLLLHVSISVAGIEVASIMNCAIEATSASAAPRTNPLLAAKQRVAQQQRLYQRIFISYSRKDTAVVEAYQKAQQALGNDVFRDTDSIRTGEDWQAALAQAIDEADIFQLFWSDNSASSPNVRDEWEYALQVRCAEDACVSFIRPVHWQKPLAVVPDELGHLNFRFVELG